MYLSQEDYDHKLQDIKQTILKGLPGSMSMNYNSLNNIKKMIDNYKNLNKIDLQQNLKYFLLQILPYAKKYQIKLAIHPDDPANFNLFGIPRIVSSYEDFQFIAYISSIYQPYNGFTYCCGSLAANSLYFLNKFITF